MATPNNNETKEKDKKEGVKVTSPTITPTPMTPEQKQSGELQAPETVTAPTVEVEAAKAVEVAAPEKITPELAQLEKAQAPEEVTAAAYEAAKVDPKATQVEAAKTEYKPEVAAATTETPQEALVSHQMQELTQGLESGNIPLWAQGAVAAVDAQLAARGLSRSSIGSAELTNAIMQSALPIAQQNASTVQQTSLANLQNRQTANNLTAQLRTQVEMTNLSNEQQARLANQASQQSIMLSNQAAENAGKQFNAQSQNQIDTFMANLKAQTEQFNTAQANAMEQSNKAQINAANIANVQLELEAGKFNAAQANAMAQLNQQIAVDLQKFSKAQSMQADMFNKQNQLAVSQSNIQWRRQVATADTAMQHESNMQNAQMKFQLTQAQLANYWQVMRDRASWAWQSQENALNRQTQLLINSQDNKARTDAAATQAKAAKEQGYADAIGTVIGAATSAWLGK